MKYYQNLKFLKNIYKDKDLIKNRGLFLKKYSNRKYSLRDFIVKILPPLKNKKILDVGCGNGSFLTKLYKIYPYNIFFGLDIVENKYCKQLSFLNYKIYDGKNFPKYKDQFDLIICMHTLYHIHNFLAFFDQIKNNLAKNGLFIITTKSKYTLPNIESKFKKIIDRLRINDRYINKERDESRFCLENGYKILNKYFSNGRYLIKNYTLETKLVVDNKKNLLDYIISTPRYGLFLKNESDKDMAKYLNYWDLELNGNIFIDKYIETIFIISRI